MKKRKLKMHPRCIDCPFNKECGQPDYVDILNCKKPKKKREKKIE